MNLKALGDWASTELASLPTIAFRVVVLTVLDFLTFALVAALCFFKNTHDAVPVLNVWMTFLGFCHGFSLGALGVAAHTPTMSSSGRELVAPIPLYREPQPEVTTVTTPTSTTTTSRPGVGT